jgi:spermidine dehydrogenase
MIRTPCRPDLPEHDQNRAGRAELLATSFETFERNIRDQLGRRLKDGGFDAATDQGHRAVMELLDAEKA